MRVYGLCFSLVAVLLLILFLASRRKGEALGTLGKISRPQESPYYVALSLGFMPKLEEAVASFILYWKDLGVVSIEDDGLRILKVLPETTPRDERMLFQAIFGKNAFVLFSSLDKKAISAVLSSYSSELLSPFRFEDDGMRKRRRLILSISFISIFFMGLFSTGLHFSLYSLSALLSSLSLFVIFFLLSRNYFSQKSQMSLFSKIRFCAFPLVCSVFFLTIYGYVLSLNAGKGFGIYMAFVLFLTIFLGTFCSFSLCRSGVEREMELKMFSLYAESLEKSEIEPEDVAYCTCFRLPSRSELSLELRRKLLSAGISGFISIGKPSGGF